MTRQGETSARLVELFMREHLKHPDREFAGKPFLLEDWQRTNIIRPIFGCVDRHGVRKYREALIGVPRNAGKSNIAAALCLTIMVLEPVVEGEYVVIARNRAQAKIVFNKARRMVYADPYLRAICDVRTNEIVIRETGARFYTVAYDAGGAQGIHATVAIIDEYHVHKDDSMRYAILSGMIGQRNALLITITTAGYIRKGPLWDLLLSARKDPRAYVYWQGAKDSEDGRDPKVWRRANPQSWVSDQDLLDAFNSMPFSEFERYHLNRFPSSGKSRAFDAASWDAMSAVPAIDPKRPSFLGLDASFSRDSTAIVLDQVDEVGIHNWLAWIVYPDEPGIPIDRERVKAILLDIIRTYYVERMTCDPNYFVLEMLELANSHGVEIEEFRQSAPMMARAYDMLSSIVESGRGRHGGDTRLREQIVNAGTDPTAYGPRLTKIEDAMKIDAAVACAIASFVAEAEYQLYGSGPQIAVF